MNAFSVGKILHVRFHQKINKSLPEKYFKQSKFNFCYFLKLICASLRAAEGLSLQSYIFVKSYSYWHFKIFQFGN